MTDLPPNQGSEQVSQGRHRVFEPRDATCNWPVLDFLLPPCLHLLSSPVGSSASRQAPEKSPQASSPVALSAPAAMASWTCFLSLSLCIGFLSARNALRSGSLHCLSPYSLRFSIQKRPSVGPSCENGNSTIHSPPHSQSLCSLPAFLLFFFPWLLTSPHVLYECCFLIFSLS